MQLWDRMPDELYMRYSALFYLLRSLNNDFCQLKRAELPIPDLEGWNRYIRLVIWMNGGVGRPEENSTGCGRADP